MRRFYTLLSIVTFAGMLSAVRSSSQAAPKPDSPAFNSVPELEKGYRLMYEQKFPEAREVLMAWAAENPTEPFGQVSVAASYLFEEFYLQQVLTSDYFLNDKRFLGGITGTPDPARMKAFQESIAKARALANQRMKKHPRDPEALFVLALCAGMQSDADSMLMKKHYDALKMLKEANSNAELLLKEHPDTYDIYVAPGIAYYVIGSLSSSARFVLWFGGIHGDRKLGMEQVAKTAENGRYLQPFAKVILALAARRENQNALAQRLFRELKERYPESELFASEYVKAMSVPSGD